VDVALANATTAATPNPAYSHVPALAAAGASTVKTPAPSIAPSPTITAEPSPSSRRSAGGAPVGGLVGMSAFTG
jgi:hypothetical protein